MLFFVVGGGVRGFLKRNHSFPVQNRNLPDFSGLFQGFLSEKGGVTKVRTILYDRIFPKIKKLPLIISLVFFFKYIVLRRQIQDQIQKSQGEYEITTFLNQFIELKSNRFSLSFQTII